MSAYTAEERRDEQEIKRTLDLLYDAIDAKDWARCRRLLADDVRVDFGELSGSSEPMHVSAVDLTAAWASALPAEKLTQHMHTNHAIRVDGDRAEVTSKAHAINVLARPKGSSAWEVWGTYRHVLTRTTSGWCCAEIAVSVIHASGNEAVRDHVSQ